MSRRVTVVQTGIANSASVVAAFERLGCSVTLASDGDSVSATGPVVLPGVGTFGAGMAQLEATGLAGVLRERVVSGAPTLAICLGMQLLFESSAESDGVRGLGVVEASIGAFAEGVRRPQFGWNRVVAGDGCSLLRDGHAYFANSFCASGVPDGWCGAMSDHGGPFVAAMERGAVLACQFHPELSGAWGQALLGRWLDRAEGA